MDKLPVTNSGTTNLHVGGKVIRPGETGFVAAHLVPKSERQPDPAPANEDTTDPVALQAAIGVKDIVGALPSMPLDRLDLVEQHEKAGKARKGVLEGVAAERLRRAADPSHPPAGAGDGAGGGQGGDA